MWSIPAVSLAVYAVSYAASDAVSRKTKGLVSSILCLSLIYLAGFLTGIFPADSIASTGIPAMLSAFGTLCIVSNIGTLIRLRDFAREWKTVTICLCGVGALAIFALASAALFDRMYALCSIPALSGGVVALLIMKDALARCQEQYVAFTMLCYAIHSFIGLPAASLLLRKYCHTDPSGQRLLPPPARPAAEGRLRLFPVSPDATSHAVFARLAVVVGLAALLSAALGEHIPASLLGLGLGILATELGFLAPNSLQKCGYYELMMFFMISSIVDPLSTVTLPALGMCVAPLIYFTVGGCAAILLGGMAAGRLLGVDWRLACALSCGCLLGFPSTLIVAEDVVDHMGYSEETRLAVRTDLGLKMVIAGFATVSTSSVVISSLIAPLLG